MTAPMMGGSRGNVPQILNIKEAQRIADAAMKDRFSQAGQGTKVPLAQANYREGTPQQCCGNCSHFQPPSGCDCCDGQVNAQGMCDMWDNEQGEPAQMAAGEQEPNQ